MEPESSNSKLLLKIAMHTHVFLGRELVLCTFKRRGKILYLPLYLGQSLYYLPTPLDRLESTESVENLLGCRRVLIDRKTWIFQKIEAFNF